MNHLSIFSTIITFIFAAAVFARWRYKKPNHLLLWGLGLVFYGLGTLSEAVMSFTFNPWFLKLWYLTGAMLTAAWLGQGTVYLLVRKRVVADFLMILLTIASLVSLALIIMSPVTAAASGYKINLPASVQYKEILERNGFIIFLTILLNVYGTVTLVGGAIYSAFLFWRKSVLANRMFGNLLIAGGALMPAMAGSFVKAGLVDWLYLSEFLGVVLMYGGFTLATSTRPAEDRIKASPASSGS
ncbi:MAG: hypothetical protein QME21_00430 [Anaerolineales bacterium]|jgi:hypothetical protein|nr:hypothetical protein [Anaerolineales bacterium]